MKLSTTFTQTPCHLQAWAYMGLPSLHPRAQVYLKISRQVETESTQERMKLVQTAAW